MYWYLLKKINLKEIKANHIIILKNYYLPWCYFLSLLVNNSEKCLVPLAFLRLFLNKFYVTLWNFLKKTIRSKIKREILHISLNIMLFGHRAQTWSTNSHANPSVCMPPQSCRGKCLCVSLFQVSSNKVCSSLALRASYKFLQLMKY